MISASKRAELCLDRYIKSSGNIPEPNPFEVHLVLLDTALANWRPYIVDLTERITRQVFKAYFVDVLAVTLTMRTV